MISIIIASTNTILLAQIEDNIQATVGIPFEIISFDNSEGKVGLCEVYNRGAKKAKFDVLCFMHEDIKIHTLGWGKIVADIFAANKKLGLIGVAGSQYKSLAPSGWHCYDIDALEIMYYNLIQNYKYTDKQSTRDYSNDTDTKLARVVCIDGVWMCSTKQAIDSYSFDQGLLKGFHGYDLDFSLGINQTHEVAVTFEVLIEHFSEGRFNTDWLKEILKIHAKWSKHLPINLTHLDKRKLKDGELRGFKNIFRRMCREGLKSKEMFQLIQASRGSKLMTLDLYLTLMSKAIKYALKRLLTS
jgi:glycosyltransferase involved in cell wall biosynthesis